MNSFIENFTQKCIQKPELIYLFDGIGACISLLGQLLLYNYLQEYFTLSFEIRKILLSHIGLIIVGDVFLYFKKTLKYLRLIEFANLYSVIKTVSILITEYEHITSVEIAYFSIEILVLIAVIALENHIFRTYKSQLEG
jgi:hypothetical protein